MDEFIHWPKPYLHLSATCDEILSWMIEIWTKNHFVSDNNCNSTVNPKCPKNLQGVTNNVGLTFSVGLVTPYHGLQSVLSKTIRINDTTYHIQGAFVTWVKNDTLGEMLQQCITPNDKPH